jgi:hypothetical protein
MGRFSQIHGYAGNAIHYFAAFFISHLGNVDKIVQARKSLKIIERNLVGLWYGAIWQAFDTFTGREE